MFNIKINKIMDNFNKIEHLTDIQKDILLRAKDCAITTIEAVDAALKDNATRIEIIGALNLAHGMGIK